MKLQETEADVSTTGERRIRVVERTGELVDELSILKHDVAFGLDVGDS